MGIEWNKEQLDAITERNRNLLVSAAAGSGKTTVLVERIRRLIIEEKVPVDRFLIVTFTKAAASEMKEKIIRALKEAGVNNEKDRQYLREQLEKVPTASISTFNSFALDVVRKYFYIINLEPGFKTCDESQARLFKQEAMENVFADNFEKGNEEFLKFLKEYADERSEDKPKSMVLNLHTMIMSMPEPFEWLKEKTERLKNNEEEFRAGEFMEQIMEICKTSAENAIKYEQAAISILEDNGCNKIADKLREEYEPTWNYPKNGGYDEVKEWFCNGSSGGRLYPVKDEKESYNLVKDSVKKVREEAKAIRGNIVKELFSESLTDQIKVINDTYEYARTLAGLVEEFDREYKRLKDEKNLLDFSDQEHLALQILKDELVASEYRQKFEYIFVDEYQDTNDVQEALIGRICRNNNLFMVGDVKQSIYKFRLAEPEIFMKKYNAYESDCEDSKRIDLNRNFRSKGNILKGVNDIFLKRMEGYEGNAALIKGINYDGALDMKPHLTIIDNEFEEDEASNNDLSKMKQVDLEATAAGNIIKKIIGEKIEAEGKERKIGYRDIVILLRSIKRTAPAFAEVLGKMGIPCYLDDSDGYFDSLEVSQVINMLRLADNSRQDIPLISVLLSPVFGFTPEELSFIRIAEKKIPYYEAFNNYAASGTDEKLSQKCRNTIETIAKWKEMAKTLPLSETVWNIIWNTGYYKYAGALPMGERRKANLRALVDKTVKAEAMGIYDLYGFIKYVDSVKEGKVSVGQMKTLSEADDVVRIMTVHKSKGLEFPVVIAGMLDKKYNLAKETDISMHKRFGFSIPFINSQEHWKKKTMIQSVIDRKIREESIEEEKRILYVELTRAKDRLYMIGLKNGITDSYDNYAYDGYDSMPINSLDYILPAAYKSENIDTKIIKIKDISSADKAKDNIDGLLKSDIKYSNEIGRRLSFSYPYEKETKLKFKYSVTELNVENSDILIPMKNAVIDAGEKTDFSAAEKGSFTHKVMECIDFKNPDIEYTISELIRKNILTDVQSKVVNREGISAFLESGVGLRARKADKIYKEKPFTFTEVKDGTQVMIQGVIDCYFEEEGNLILLDYKNIGTSDEELIREKYEEQINIYTRALEGMTGMTVKERYLCLLKQNKTIKM